MISLTRAQASAPYRYSALQFPITGWVALKPKQNLDCSQDFTISFWVRFYGERFLSPIFNQWPQIAIAIAGPLIRVDFISPDHKHQVITSVPIIRQDTWHFVAVTYSRSARKALLVIDGAIAGHIDGLDINPEPSDYIDLGSRLDVGSPMMQLLSVCFWQRSFAPEHLKPEWQMPEKDPALRACYCFSKGEISELAAQGTCDVNGPELKWYVRNLRLGANAWLGLSRPQMPAPQGAPDGVSIGLWINLDPQEIQTTDFQCLVAARLTATTMLRLGLKITPDAKIFNLEAYVGDTAVGGPVPILAEQWTHVAVSLSPSRITLFIGGREAVHGAPPPNLAMSVEIIAIGAVVSEAGSVEGNSFEGLVNDFRLWRRPFSEAQWMDILGSEQSALEPDVDLRLWCLPPANVVSGGGQLLVHGAWMNETSERVGTSVAAGIRRAASVSEGEWRLRAATQPHLRLPESRGGKQSLSEWLASTTPMSGLPDLDIEAIAATLAQQFGASLEGCEHEGLLELLRLNCRCHFNIPRFHFEQDGTHIHLFAFVDGEKIHLDSAALVSRDAACILFYVSLFMSVLSIVLSALGVIYRITSLKDAAKIVIEGLDAAQMELVRKAIPLATLVSGYTPIKIIKTLAEVVGLGRVLLRVFSDLPWYSFALTVASVAAQIALIWLSDTAYLLLMIAQIAMNLASLIATIVQKPAQC